MLFNINKSLLFDFFCYRLNIKPYNKLTKLVVDFRNCKNVQKIYT